MNATNPIRRRLNQCETLPSLPAIALQLLEVCQDDDLNVRKVVELISRDPALSAKVLKVVNSPLYGLHREVTTLTHAFALLGLESMRTLALSFSLAHSIRQTGVRIVDRDHFWKRSVLAAVASRAIASWNRIKAPEELFLASLLQDIGVLALGKVLGETYGRLVAASRGNHDQLIELEKTELGLDHAQVSGWIAETWFLPERFRLMLKASHWPLPEDVPADLSTMSRCVALSGRIADMWLNPDTASATQIAGRFAEKWLGAGREDVRWILTRVAEEIPQITPLFEVDLGSHQVIYNVLEKAKETLLHSALRASTSDAEIVPVPHAVVQKALMGDSLIPSDPEAITEILDYEFRRACQGGSAITLLTMRIGNRASASATEELDLKVAQIAMRKLRPSDWVLRYRSHLLLAILPGTATEGAEQVLQRLSRAIETSLDTNVEMGLASAPSDEGYHWNETLEQAENNRGARVAVNNS